jgi:hypothetical protein
MVPNSEVADQRKSLAEGASSFNSNEDLMIVDQAAIELASARDDRP